MHILIIPSWYKSINEPVLGSFFEEQARGLMQEGNKVGIMYSNFYPLKKIFEKKAEYIYYMDDNGIPTYSFAIQSFVPRSRDLNYYYIGLATVRVFKHYVKQNGFPDIIHAHSAFHAGIAAAFLSKKYNIPYVITEHLTHYMTGGINHVDDLEYARKIFTGASRAFAVSNAFKIELTKTLNLTDNTFKVMHNMVSNHFFENAFEKKYIQGEPFIFLINSFLNARKNHELAFSALRILIDKKYNVKIRVGGYGEYETELRRIIASLRLQNHVTLLGSLSRAAVKEEMSNSHAFLLPSKYETFGVVLIESMACGRPVISTNSGGPADIVTEHNGILLHTFDVNDFANAMEQMILNYDTYDQQAISNHCFENYSQTRISNLLMKEYAEVLASNKTATSVVSGNNTNLLLTFNYCPYFASQPVDYVQYLIDTTN
ncbi:MAG: glycosyltransferase [Bacteroidetes bacterium]|nr:glycosyltransferase [Bacteroidota bacterium]